MSVDIAVSKLLADQGKIENSSMRACLLLHLQTANMASWSAALTIDVVPRSLDLTQAFGAS